MSLGYLEVMASRIIAHTCQWDPMGHRGSFDMNTLDTMHNLFQGHSLDIVSKFENFSRIMLNSMSSTRIPGSFPACLMPVGLGLLGMLKDDLRSS